MAKLLSLFGLSHQYGCGSHFTTFNLKQINNDMDEFLKTKAGLNYLQMKYPNSTVMDAINDFNKWTICPSINNKQTAI